VEGHQESYNVAGNRILGRKEQNTEQEWNKNMESRNKDIQMIKGRHIFSSIKF